MRLQDMQEKAIKFIQEENQEMSSSDYQFFMKSQNPFANSLLLPNFHWFIVN